MKESFIISFLLFFSNINEYFPESNDCNKNSFINYNIFLQIINEGNKNSIIRFNSLYNDYGLKYNESFNITNISHIYTHNIDFIILIPNSLYIINDEKIFTDIINELMIRNLYDIKDNIILLVNGNILNNFSIDEVKKYKSVENCYIISYKNNSITNQLLKIKKDYQKLNILLNINLTYDIYPTLFLIIFISIFFSFLCFFLLFYIRKYLKKDASNKLGIHIIIFICFLLLIFCHIFVFVEIFFSEKCLLFKLITQGFLVNKIIKTIFFSVTKNIVILLLLLITRAYCILFFDKKYMKKYLKSIIIVLFIDYGLQIFFMYLDQLFEFTFFKKLYNILYFSLFQIYFYLKGKDIDSGLKYLLSIIGGNDRNDINERTQEELKNIKEIIKMKITLRKKFLIIIQIFMFVSILISIILLIPFFYKYSLFYNIIILTLFSIFIFVISLILYPKKLPDNYILNYEQLIKGIHNDFSEEYFFVFSDDYFIQKNNFDLNLIYGAPVIIINPFQVLSNNNEFFSINDTNENDDKEANKNYNIINSFLDRGQIGYLELFE